VVIGLIIVKYSMDILLIFLELFPLYVAIFCAEPRHKRISTSIGAMTGWCYSFSDLFTERNSAGKIKILNKGEVNLQNLKM